MNRRLTIFAVTVLALMLAGIAFAVSRLYREDRPVRQRAATSDTYPLLRAVPSDAAAVFCFDGSRAAGRVLADSTGLLQAVLSPDNKAFMAYLAQAGEHRTAVSLHNSGALIPLVITQLKHIDSTTVASYSVLAEAAGLKTCVQDGLLLASRSETLLGSARRHLDAGLCILSSKGLADATDRTKGAAVAFLSNQQAAKLLQVWSTAKIRRHTDFVRGVADWTALEIAEVDDKHLVLKGTAACPDEASSFLTAFRGTSLGTPAFAEALPYFTDYAIALPVGDIDAYLAAYREYVDARGGALRYDRERKARISRDMSPEEWARHVQVKEVVKASFHLDDGPHEVALVRTGRDLKLKGEESNPYRGSLKALFGEAFAIVDTACTGISGRWVVYGDAIAVRAYTDRKFLDYSLKSRLSDAGVTIPEGFVTYSSLSDYPAVLTDLFSKPVAAALGRYTAGTAFAPALTSAALMDGQPDIRITVDKRALKGTKVPVLERDTTVVIPTGLFPVQNSATGQTNYFYQNANLYLCLNDENGKGVWGVPFKTPICGAVESIDYYGNGKVQFLFAAGSSLYLIDRLGRFVGGFPVELGKGVLLGPRAYDFTGAHGYTVMVLHKDNSLEMYNLHGRKPTEWKGIYAPETVKSLPELVEVKGKHYWAVRTSVRTLIYGFYGGGPLIRDEGGKMLRPDSQLTVTPRGALTVDCYDGKTRDIKL